MAIVHCSKLSQTAEQLYGIYKQRNEIEVMFDAYKNFLEADKTYMQNRFVLEGWLFVNFLAMIAYYKLFDRLREAKLLHKYSPKDIIEIAKAIHQIRIRGTWLRAEMTKKTKHIFKKIKIDRLT
jgi:transposase